MTTIGCLCGAVVRAEGCPPGGILDPRDPAVREWAVDRLYYTGHLDQHVEDIIREVQTS